MTGAAGSLEPHHLPVLPAEVLTYLAHESGQTVVDATVGVGGHASLLAQCVEPNGRVIGLDRDAAMLDLARKRLAPNVMLVQSSFDSLREILDQLGIAAADAALADLG